jgi:hypothetical protein
MFAATGLGCPVRVPQFFGHFFDDAEKTGM